MIGLRRGYVPCRFLTRHNSSLQVPGTVADSTVLPVEENRPETPATSTGEAQNTQARARVWKTRRPHISLAHPRQWNRPLASGVLPAYDEALRVIQEDSLTLKREAHYCQTTLKQAEETGDSEVGSIQQMRDRLNMLQVQSEINLPDVRWKFRNGLADMSKPVYRYLAEHKWRNEGDLDLLMERIHQMNVVPDVLPSLHPNFDLRITFPEPPPRSIYLRTRVKRQYKQVEPGIFLIPEQTRKPPRLYTSVFHLETRLYTMLMADPDVPDTESQSFQTYLHWMQPNIVLSALSQSPIPLSNVHTRYVPPHPQRGMPYHRYVLLLLPQTERITIPTITDSERLGFNVREFAEKYGLDGNNGGAAHMWREVWDEEVFKIYADVLKMDEPRFALPPKPDRYADIRGTKRYIK